MEPLRKLAREIHRRSIWQVMSVYTAGGWIAFSIVQSLTEGLDLPSWFPPFAIVLLIIGLPIVLATAIVQEGVVGPEPPPQAIGDVPAPDATGALDKLFTWRNAIGGGVLAFALWGVIAAGWMLFGPGTIVALSGPTVAKGQDSRKTIAVLPFTSARTDDDSESFRAGLHDELLTQLFKVGDLRVTSRTSVLEYDGSMKSVTEIGRELGVGVLVEGSVQREGETVRINAQLIDVATDEHLWAESYTESLSAANIILMQSEVVRDIAGTLSAVLSPAEERRLSDVPTDNMEAYDYYLRGRAKEVTRADEDLMEAAQMFEEAVDRDPNFALAHARLGMAHNSLNWYGVDATEERLAKSRASIDRAFELEPNLAEAHLALGRYYYQGRRDYERALTELELAEAGHASDAEVFTLKAAIERRTGKLADAVLSWTLALEVDPRNPGLAWDVANTLTALRRFEEADYYYARALEIAPDRWTQNRRRAWNQIAWNGDIEEARRILAKGEGNVSEADVSERTWAWYELELLARDPEAALEYARSVGEEWIPLQFDVVFGPSLVGEAYWRLGEREKALESFDLARVALEARLEALPDDAFVHSALSRVHARLGNSDEAVRLASKASSLLPVAVDSWRGPDLMRNLAVVYAVTDRPEDAIDVLEQLLAMPSRAVSREVLRLDPVWDPLREHPGFLALLNDD